jgi:hypothetical protein
MLPVTSQRHPTSPVNCLLNLAAGISTYLSPTSVDTSTTPPKNHVPTPTISPRSRLSLLSLLPTQPLPSLIVDNETTLECRPRVLSLAAIACDVWTGKNHLISVFSSTHLDFFDDLWDGLLPYAEITLNVIRSWRPDPSLSA